MDDRTTWFPSQLRSLKLKIRHYRAPLCVLRKAEVNMGLQNTRSLSHKPTLSVLTMYLQSNRLIAVARRKRIGGDRLKRLYI